MIVFQGHVVNLINFYIDSQSSHNLQINNSLLMCVIYFVSLISCDMFRAIFPSSDNTTYNLLGDIDIIRRF
jgi:hypothetical protein